LCGRKEENEMKTVLTIAGSDSSGGAGIQADIKTMTALGVYGMSAIAALTAQNTTGVAHIMEVTPEFLAKQLDCIFTDIYPDAVKIGMVSSTRLIETIAERLKFYRAKNIVVDPVMVSTSGSKLLRDDAIETLKNCLFPLATVLTPNVPEASVLTGMRIENEEDMIEAAGIISRQFGCAVLCKGGHRVSDASDLLCYDNKYKWFRGERIVTKNTHGTGCTLSSAIACGLAMEMNLEESIKLAKDYVTGALKSMLELGKGNGPLNHMWNICTKKTEKSSI